MSYSSHREANSKIKKNLKNNLAMLSSVVWAYSKAARFSETFESQKRARRGGVVALEDNEGRREKRTSRCFHMDYFITEYLFSAALV